MRIACSRYSLKPANHSNSAFKDNDRTKKKTNESTCAIDIAVILIHSIVRTATHTAIKSTSIQCTHTLQSNDTQLLIRDFPMSIGFALHQLTHSQR